MIRWIIVLAFLALCAVIAQVWGGGYSIIYWRTREPFPGPFDKLGKIITKKFKILPNGHM